MLASKEYGSQENQGEGNRVIGGTGLYIVFQGAWLRGVGSSEGCLGIIHNRPYHHTRINIGILVSFNAFYLRLMFSVVSSNNAVRQLHEKAEGLDPLRTILVSLL